MSIEKNKDCIKCHDTSLEHCVSCKLSLTYPLYSLKQFYLDNKCDSVRESASAYLISMFSNCSALSRLS